MRTHELGMACPEAVSGLHSLRPMQQTEDGHRAVPMSCNLGYLLCQVPAAVHAGLPSSPPPPLHDAGMELGSRVLALQARSPLHYSHLQPHTPQQLIAACDQAIGSLSHAEMLV